MANIYSMAGEEITMGLQSLSKCDEAIDAARSIARDRGETVRLEDDSDMWDVHPDGSIEEGDEWECDECE